MPKYAKKFKKSEIVVLLKTLKIYYFMFTKLKKVSVYIFKNLLPQNKVLS